MSERWGIAGGGMLGLAVAMRLAEAGEAVDVIETQPQLGGLASEADIGPVRWDRFYHVILATDTYTRVLLRQLDLEQDMQWRAVKTGFYARGQVFPLTTPGEFLRFPVLNWWEKVRLGVTMVLAPRVQPGAHLEEITAVDWVRRYSGRGAVDKFWRPLLVSKLGDQAETVSASFLHATMVRLMSARKLGVGQEQFGYLPGSYGRIVRSLATTLEALGVRIRTGIDFSAVRAEYRRAVVTVPAPVAAKWGDEFGHLGAIQYQGVVCTSFLLRQPLSPYYITNLGDGGLPFTGVVDMTALVDAKEFGGYGLVYLPKYVGPEDGVWGRSDGNVVEQAWNGLRRIYPHLAEGDRVAAQVARARYVFPVPTAGHAGRIPPMTTQTPGVYVVNASHIRNGTLNVNETLQLAEQAVAVLLKQELG